MDLLRFLLARAKEPSSYAGLAALLTAAGVPYSTDAFNAAVAVAIAVAGLIAILVPETKTTVKSLVPLLMATVMLAACAAPQPAAKTEAAPTDPLAAVAQFTVADLQAADAIAQANNDALGHACYPALVQLIQSLPQASPSTTVAGAFSVFETARVTRIKVESAAGASLPDYLKLGCAPLLMDEQTFLLRLAAIGAGSAIGLPVVQALPK